VSAPPRTAGRCDKCGGELTQRSDDTHEAVANRLDVYKKQTAPLLAYYRQRGLLAPVAGEGAMGDVAADIRTAVKRAVPA
jgi:adenylate kinase